MSRKWTEMGFGMPFIRSLGGKGPLLSLRRGSRSAELARAGRGGQASQDPADGVVFAFEQAQRQPAGARGDASWGCDMANGPIDDLEPMALPKPTFEGCRELFEALKVRHTSRNISAKEISLQTLADILWAAQGVNREKGPFGGHGRTAGSASNSQEIRMYVLLAEGTYLYEPEPHRLAPVAAGDLRRLAIGRRQQDAGADAPVRLVYVADIERFKHAGFPEPGLYDAEVQKSYYYVDTGLMAQNVYLAAASLGLAAWFHNCDREGFAEAVGLAASDLRPLFGQTIGWPGSPSLA